MGKGMRAKLASRPAAIAPTTRLNSPRLEVRVRSLTSLSFGYPGAVGTQPSRYTERYWVTTTPWGQLLNHGRMLETSCIVTRPTCGRPSCPHQALLQDAAQIHPDIPERLAALAASWTVSATSAHCAVFTEQASGTHYLVARLTSDTCVVLSRTGAALSAHVSPSRLQGLRPGLWDVLATSAPAQALLPLLDQVSAVQLRGRSVPLLSPELAATFPVFQSAAIAKTGTPGALALQLTVGPDETRPGPPAVLGLANSVASPDLPSRCLACMERPPARGTPCPHPALVAFTRGLAKDILDRAQELLRQGWR